MIAKPFHATRSFIRIEILIFQGQERLDLEFVPRPLFVAGAGKYEDAAGILDKKCCWKCPKFAALILGDELGELVLTVSFPFLVHSRCL